MTAASDVDAAVARIEELMAEVGEADPDLARTCEQLVRELMHLYGGAFARVLEIVGAEAGARLAEDKLLASLLVLHELHPVSAEARIRGALARIERRLDARICITDLSGDRVRLRIEWNPGAVPAPAAAGMIERAVAAEAPEVVAIEIEGPPAVSLVQIAPVGGATNDRPLTVAVPLWSEAGPAEPEPVPSGEPGAGR